jgi:diguanylate cyclase
MRSWHRRLRAASGSLKLRLTIGSIAALMFGIGLTTVLLVRQAERDTLAAQRGRELGEAVRTAATLSRRVLELQRALQLTAELIDAPAMDDDARLAALLASQPVLRAMFASLVVASPDGQAHAFADSNGVRRPVLSIADRTYFQRTVAEQRPIISEPLSGRMSGEPVVMFTYPLRGPRGLHGVILGSLRLASRDLLADLVDTTEVDTDARLVVTDASGRVLAHPERTRVMRPLSEDPRLAEAFAQWVATGSSVEPSGLTLAQTGELVSASGVAGPDWMVWRVLPEEAFLAPLHAARQQALAWAAGLIALMSLLLPALLWWQLHPLALLEQRARHLFDGTHAPQSGWPAAGGEIGRLSRVLRRVGVERARLEKTNNRVMRRLGSVMTAAPVGIAFTRAQRFELVSAEFCRLFARSEADLLSRPAQTIHACDADHLAIGPQVAKAFAAGEAYAGEWQMRRADGGLFWGLLRARPVDAEDAGAGTIWTITDVSEQVTAREQLEWSAAHDTLTGLANRKAFEHRLAAVFGALPRSLPAALVMIDLDHFKPINDSAGHAAGDAMLKAVAAAISSRVRASDLVVRLGGDEFALLLEHCSPEVALRVAENVRAAIASILLPWERHLLQVGASLGVAMLAEDTQSSAAWLEAADAACYAAKAAGRGAVRSAQRPPLRVVSTTG